MNIRRFLSAVLIGASALLLVSCGLLASTGTETGHFAFQFNPEMLGSSARIDWADRYIIIRAHLYSSDAAYDITERRTLGYYELFDDENEFLDPPPAITFSFDDIPLNKQMNLKIDCTGYYVEDGDIEEYDWLTTVTKRFTLTSSDPLNLNSSLFRDIETPYLFTRYNSGIRAFWSQDIPDYNSQTGYFDMSDTSGYEDSLYHSHAYCFFGGDEYSDMNLAYLVTANSYYAESYDNYNVSEENNLQSLLYDPVTQKLCVVYNENSDGSKIWKAAVLHQEAFASLNAALENPSEYGRIVALGGNGSISPFSKDANIDFESDNVYEPPVAYAYDGYLYSLRSFDHEQSDKSITLCKFSLKTGELVSTAKVAIPQVSPSGSSYKRFNFDFNDMAVSDGLIYILFHQRELWVGTSFDQSMYYFTPSTEEEIKPGYVDRGGIFVYDADSLKKEKTLGVAPVKNSITVRLTNPDHMYFLYRNYDESTGVFSNPLAQNYSLKWSVPAANSLNFANPLKIVAIMPKKLVIVDSGAFMYDGGGINSINDINITTPAYKIGVNGESRLVTVDLEDFSNSEIEGNFNMGEDFYRLTSDSCFLFNLSVSESELPVYAKKVWEDPNNNYRADPIEYTSTDNLSGGASFMLYY